MCLVVNQPDYLVVLIGFCSEKVPLHDHRGTCIRTQEILEEASNEAEGDGNACWLHKAH